MASSLSRLAALATQIAEGTHSIDSYLQSNGLQQPSFEADGPMDLKLSPALQDVKNAVLDASQELQELLYGPAMLIFSHNRIPWFVYGVIGRFGIANKVPMDGEVSYMDLAKVTGINESTLTHILRYAIAYRVFNEKRPGYISHSPLSKLLAGNPRMQESLDMIREELLVSSVRLADALEKWPSADEPGQTAYLLANRSEEANFFDHLALYPQQEQRFGSSMKTLAQYSDITAQYPWDSLGSGTVVDVGGSAGEAAFSIASKFPDLKMIVQDLPQVVGGAKEQDGLNVTFMAHDFFEEQPVKGADAYIYRRCFHDWPDKYCIRMLKALVPALKSGAKILIVDVVAAPFGVLPNRIEREVRHMDMLMHIIQNAKERDLEEWKNLLAAADPRLHVHEVRQTKQSILGVLEVVFEP